MLGTQNHDEVSSLGKILPCLALQQGKSEPEAQR